ncbi:Cysteine-rich secretory protein family [Sphingobacterium spiritivorum]|uniref:Cysteine-rich secretory protein family n=1 Tax=Sphingobacterium spiritivorum TaxID=258 RepID=A0A380C8N5_SPHSI|nr:CAP domain-containing protein [Sphingobacterium spiritivorum]SUJ15447.1 Cysteine-rich secretory protein family [Sphingobacterium spiritivorum]
MKYLIVAIFSLVVHVAQAQRITTERDEAKEAYVLLNDIRSNPSKYKKQLGISDIQNVTRKALVWNKQLAKVAEERAYDMAKRDYFDHITPDGVGVNVQIADGGYTLNKDWLKNIKANNFESIAANHPSAVEGIRALIIGKGSPGFMHRKHLLGMDKWNGSLQDIGIGYVRIPSGATYKSYLCVIIAKHDW